MPGCRDRGRAGVRFLRAIGGDATLYRSPSIELVIDLPDDQVKIKRWDRMMRSYSLDDIMAHMEFETPTVEWVESKLAERFT